MTENGIGRHQRDAAHGGHRWLWSLAALAAIGLVAGCGGSSNKTTGTTAPTTAPTTAAGGSGTTASTPGAVSGSNGQLGALAQEIQSGSHSVFKAVYTYSGAGTPSMTVTIEQDPPKSVLIAGGGEVLATGSATYYCTTGAGAVCVSTGTTNPLGSLSALFSSSSALSAIQQAEAEATAHTAGYNASFSTQSFGGVSADCATITAASTTSKYCVTHSGILAYSGIATTSGAPTSSFQLTSYSSNPSPSDFSPPAGATITSTP